MAELGKWKGNKLGMESGESKVVKVQKIASADNEILMETMRENGRLQENPQVGMFWYNPARNRLVGVYSAYASELSFNAKGRKTMQVLHHKVWQDVREDAIENGSIDKIWEEEDYTQVPRGRIFQIEVPNSNAEYFEVLVGSWIKEYPQAVDLILKRFNLEHSDYQFIHSEHWDVGRGTSEFLI